MSEIEKAVAEYKDCLGCGHKDCLSLMSDCRKKYNIQHYQMEAYCAIAGSIPLDRLEAICTAERDGRCVVLPCKSDEFWTENESGKRVRVVKITTDRHGTYVYWRYKGFGELRACNPIYFKKHFTRAEDDTALRKEQDDER